MENEYFKASDKELLSQVESGDRCAFDNLVSRYQAPLRRRIASMIRDQAIVEDVLQEVYIRIWNKADSYSGSGPVGAWIHRIAFNQALSEIRKSRRNPTAQLSEGTETEKEDVGDQVHRMLETSLPGPEALFERRELASLVRSLLRTLPESKQDVIRLVHGQDMTVEQAAAALGVPPGTVKSRLYYGRKALERGLREHLED